MNELSHRCPTCGVTRQIISATNLTPTSSETGPRILVAVEEDTLTPAGLVVVSEKLAAVYFGTVLSVAPATRDVRPGDRVVFVRSVGVKVPIPGIGETRLIHEHEVLGIVNKEAA